MLVVRFRVAAHTCRVRGKVQRLDVTGGRHALVAVDAIDAVRGVGRDATSRGDVIRARLRTRPAEALRLQ